MSTYLKFIYFINFFSFLVPPEVYPGRIALLLTVILALINLLVGIMNDMPYSENINMLEIWMLSCIGFVALAIIIYGLILCQVELRCWKRDYHGRRILDNIALISFPFLFASFVFIYFYMNLSQFE